MFDRLKNLPKGISPKMIAQAVILQRQLASEEIIIEEEGVKIVITGEQKIKELFVQGVSNQTLVDVLNKAIKKSQEVAARKLQSMSGDLLGR